MAQTYSPIATTTLGTAASSITFSSIPSTYTDLRVVLVQLTSVDGTSTSMRFNSDSTTLYSQTDLGGYGTSAFSQRATNATALQIGGTDGTSIPGFKTIDIFSYVGSTNKTTLQTVQRDRNGSGGVEVNVGLYRSTSAITSITFLVGSGTFNAGTTATIWGIKAA